MIKEISTFIAARSGFALGTTMAHGIFLPENPDRCVLVSFNIGGAVDFDLPDRADIVVQCLARAVKYNDSCTDARTIYEAIHGAAGWDFSILEPGTMADQAAIDTRATSEFSGGTYGPSNVTDLGKSLTGSSINTSWYCGGGISADQRFHIDLGTGKIITRIRYENYHDSGAYTGNGARGFTFWGSNLGTSFSNLNYIIDTGWTQIAADVSEFNQHVAADMSDPNYVDLTNSGSFRYYAFKFANNWGLSGLALRRIVLRGGTLDRAYKVHTVTAMTFPQYVGPDENGRHLWTCSYVFRVSNAAY